MDDFDFYGFLNQLDEEAKDLPREPHVEQTVQGRYEDLRRYLSRYMPPEEAAESAAFRVYWEKEKGWL